MKKMKEEGGVCKSCKCPHHYLGAIVVLAVGILFLLKDWNVWNFWGITGWSALFVLVGLGLLIKRTCGCDCY